MQTSLSNRLPEAAEPQPRTRGCDDWTLGPCASPCPLSPIGHELRASWTRLLAVPSGWGIYDQHAVEDEQAGTIDMLAMATSENAGQC